VHGEHRGHGRERRPDQRRAAVAPADAREGPPGRGPGRPERGDEHDREVLDAVDGDGRAAEALQRGAGKDRNGAHQDEQAGAVARHRRGYRLVAAVT
jgi:hypothetical protein